MGKPGRQSKIVQWRSNWQDSVLFFGGGMLQSTPAHPKSQLQLSVTWSHVPWMLQFTLEQSRGLVVKDHDVE